MDFNNFKGVAKRIEDLDLPRLGAKLGVGEDRIHMFLDVESRGSGFDSQGRPVILFERHKFYKYIKNNKAKLKKAGSLANPRAGGYSGSQYAKLKKAMQIDERAALYACSWGIGQVMGFNHKLAGFATVHEMVLAFMDDEDKQLEGSINFILNTKLDDEMRACMPGDPESCRGFARGYNGTGYARNNYHVKLADALLKWSKIRDTPWNPNPEYVAVVKDVAAEGRTSTEKPLAVGTGIVAITATVKEVSENVKGPLEETLNIIPEQIVPFALFAAVLGAGYWYYKRNKKQKNAVEVLRNAPMDK